MTNHVQRMANEKRLLREKPIFFPYTCLHYHVNVDDVVQ